MLNKPYIHYIDVKIMNNVSRVATGLTSLSDSRVTTAGGEISARSLSSPPLPAPFSWPIRLVYDGLDLEAQRGGVLKRRPA
jgi:hypothetical protein